jgi:hypothetical protein
MVKRGVKSILVISVFQNNPYKSGSGNTRRVKVKFGFNDEIILSRFSGVTIDGV